MVASDAFEMVWKSVFFYVLLVALLRIMGKREISSLTAMDLVVFIMLSESAIISIADKEIPVLIGAIPVVMLAMLEMASAFLSLKSPTFRAIVEGVPAIIVEHGRVDPRQLAKQRMNINDLQAQLREHNVANVADVEFAILETSGKLSVIPKAPAAPATAKDVGKGGKKGAGLPVDLIVDGQVNRDALRQVGRDQQWLQAQLGGLRVQDVLVANLDANGRVFVQAWGAGDPEIGQQKGDQRTSGARQKRASRRRVGRRDG